MAFSSIGKVKPRWELKISSIAMFQRNFLTLKSLSYIINRPFPGSNPNPLTKKFGRNYLRWNSLLAYLNDSVCNQTCRCGWSHWINVTILPRDLSAISWAHHSGAFRSKTFFSILESLSWGKNFWTKYLEKNLTLSEHFSVRLILQKLWWNKNKKFEKLCDQKYYTEK